MAKTMMHRIRQAEEADKKPSSTTCAYSRSQRRSIEEFAVALGVTEEDAEARLAQAASTNSAKTATKGTGTFVAVFLF
ncbi:MAG: hypothetical protein ACLU0O_01915 [Collinsella sp.]